MTTTISPEKPSQAELSPEAFEILRAAVNLARNQHITKVAILRVRLQALYPGQDAQVQEALAFWADHEKRMGSHDR